MATISVLDKMISASSVPEVPVLGNLNAVLMDIYARHVALKKEDCELYYGIFTNIFYQIHKAMKDVDPYYERYSSEVKFAGSHFDRLRINKPSEYDMDIVIDVPDDMEMNRSNPALSNIVIEPKHPGFVQLRTGVQYQKSIKDNEDKKEDIAINWPAYKWVDEKYILRSAFINWFKGVVHKALNSFPDFPLTQSANSNDTNLYKVSTSESGPAITLIIKNTRGFRLDVDMVPVLRFPENHWPVDGYRSIPPSCRVGNWMVVPKPNKHGHDSYDENRSWRVTLHEQERKLMYNSHNLRVTIKLLKKLRDSKGMDKIASYYIKTLFLWEIVERNDPGFWSRNDLATLFTHMLKRFHSALREGRINYFWNSKSNLIGQLPGQVLESYANIVWNLLQSLDLRQGHVAAAKYLLTDEEFDSYKRFIH